MEEYNIPFRYLPPYSPALNPIEEVFAMAKSRYRRIIPRPNDRNEMISEIDKIFSELKGYNMRNLYEHSTSFFQTCLEKKQLI